LAELVQQVEQMEQRRLQIRLVAVAGVVQLARQPRAVQALFTYVGKFELWHILR